MVTATYPVAPEVIPLEGTLLDTATVKDGIAWLDGLDLWQSYAAMKFGQAALFCASNSKDLTGNSAAWVSGFRFAAYGGVTCKSVGLDMADEETQVRTVFERGESTAVERALMEVRFRAAAGDNTGRWATPTDITPSGGAVSPKVGVALLEGYFGSVYTGAPTIHMPRVIASILLGQTGATLDGKLIQSKLGSKIVAGAGYDYPNTGPGGSNAPTGEKWLYATGGVYIGRGPAEVRQAFDQSTNDVIMLAERGYIVAVDGPVAAVRVLVA